MSKTIKEIAEEIGVSKQAIFKRMKREPLSTSLQGLTTTVDGRLMVSVDGEKLIKQAFMKGEVSTTDNQLTTTVDGLVDGLVDGSSTKLEEKSAEVDGQNALYEILKMELQAKNEQIDALQTELTKERQHSKELAERIAVLADQAQKLQLAQMNPQIPAEQNQEAEKEPEPETIKKPWWKSLFS